MLGDRKKAVTVPSCSDHYTFLRQAVLEWTGKNVLYLERFDSDWEEWVEVEKEQFRASHKERIKAVISTPDEGEKENTKVSLLAKR